MLILYSTSLFGSANRNEGTRPPPAFYRNIDRSGVDEVDRRVQNFDRKITNTLAGLQSG
jgi:hypothetical protein